MDLIWKSARPWAFAAVLAGAACTAGDDASYIAKQCTDEGLAPQSAEWNSCVTEQQFALEQYRRNLNRVRGGP